MSPHPVLRQTIKWGGAAASLILISAWLINGKWGGYWVFGRGDCIQVDGGLIELHLGGTGWSKDVPGPYTIKHSGWWWDHADVFGTLPDGPGRYFTFSLLPLACAAILITIPAWILDARARRRARAGLCRTCHYDRGGLPLDTVCPECGSATPPFPRA
jgi:hypothetical protein